MAIPLIDEAMINTRTRHCNTVGTGQLKLVEAVVLFSRSGVL